MIEQMFSARAWNRLVINIGPGLLFLLLSGLVNSEVGRLYQHIYATYVSDKGLIWPLSIGVILAALVVGIAAEEVGGYLEGEMYDRYAAAQCDVPDEYASKRSSGARLAYFYDTWNAYLLRKADPDLPFTSFYRNRLIAFKFLLTTHVVISLILLVNFYSHCVGQCAISMSPSVLLLLALVLAVLRLKSLSRSLHEYRLLILGRHDTSCTSISNS